MRYLLVDRVTEFQPGVLIKGTKNVSLSEDYLQFHFPRYPVVPGSLVLEAFVQLAGWLEAKSSDFDNWFVLTGVTKCRFYGVALPGDRMEIEVTSVPTNEKGRPAFRALGMIDGKKNAYAEFDGRLIPLADLFDPDESRRSYDVLARLTTLS